ncbi:acetylxylan esterase [Flavobacterium flavipallidum]|uniref:Acetylxylan esterase n=1 Tax=Flavobacterium flavipallidum TaxID=3139140 RepID=A0ABU9HLP6_9FLAO
MKLLAHFSLFLGLLSITLKAQNTPAPIKLVDIILTANHSDWNYKLNEEATVKISVLRYGSAVENAEIEYQYGPEQLNPEKKGTLKLENGVGEINIGTMNNPGFRQLKVQAKIDGYIYKNEIKAGYAPFQIQPTVKLPKDFDVFWDKAKAENNKIPMDAQVTYKPELSTTTVDIYLVRLQNYKLGHYFYGYLSKPKDNKKHPVLFNPPGAGVKKIVPFTSYAEKGFISFTTEIHGVNPEMNESDFQEMRKNLSDYWAINLNDKNNYYYKAVYLGCVRAIDFLTSLPEYDQKNVVVTGGSQGGALTIVTAGIDNRVNYISAFYPALSDNSGFLYNRAGGWPSMFSDKYQNNSPEKISTMEYYDVVNFAKKIKIPGFYSSGYNDNTCSPTSTLAAFNSVTAPKEIVITPISAHWRFGETDDQSMKWLSEKCGIK